MDKQRIHLKSVFLGIAIATLGFASYLYFANPVPTASPPTPKTIVQEKVITQNCPANPAEVLLPAPELDKALKVPLISNHEGEVRVAWTKVQYAKRYRLKVLKGQEVVKNYVTPGTTLYIKELPFDENRDFTPYNLVLSTINMSDMEGAESTAYEFRVKPLKDLTAPEIIGITVEK